MSRDEEISLGVLVGSRGSLQALREIPSKEVLSILHVMSISYAQTEVIVEETMPERRNLLVGQI